MHATLLREEDLGFFESFLKLRRNRAHFCPDYNSSLIMESSE